MASLQSTSSFNCASVSVTAGHSTGSDSEQVMIQYYRVLGVKFSLKKSYEGVRFNVVAGSNPAEAVWKLWQFPLPHFASVSVFRKRQ